MCFVNGFNQNRLPARVDVYPGDVLVDQLADLAFVGGVIDGFLGVHAHDPAQLGKPLEVRLVAANIVFAKRRVGEKPLGRHAVFKHMPNAVSAS